MNLNRNLTRYRGYILITLMAFFIAACGSSEQSSGANAQAAPQSSGTPQVAYGSSLSEWEDATQGEGAQVASAETEEWPFPQDGENAVDTPEPVVLYSNQESEAADSTAEETAAEEASTDEMAVEETADELDASNIGTPFELDNVVYQQLLWDGLIPANFTAEAIMSKYQDELAAFEDGSPEATELYTQMQEEFNNAPVNDVINEVPIRLPGFIAPLDYTDDLITEFLLVPYFGACIHVPPPPANQTVLVTTADGQGIKIEDSYDPIWVMGTIVTEGTTTELAAAGYNIQDAIIEPYTVSE